MPRFEWLDRSDIRSTFNSERHRELALEVRARVESALHAVLGRREKREAAGAVRARDEGDLYDPN